MEWRSPYRLRVRLRTNARFSAAFAVASALLSGCFFFAQHTYAPWSSVDSRLRRDGDALLSNARTHSRDNVVVDVSVDYLPRSRNRALRETLMRFGLIVKTGPDRVDWTARARRILAPCPYPDGTEPIEFGCRRVVVARLRTIALTSYDYDYTGFETGEATSLFWFRFAAAPSNAIGRELERRSGLRCSKWLVGDAALPDITWNSHATCAGALERIRHPTLGDPTFVDLAFDGLRAPSGVSDVAAKIDRF
jgi:hypothetical protein